MFKNDRGLANLNECCVEKIVTLGTKHKKDYILSNIIPESLSQYHNKRSFWIHDLEFYDTTYNCIGISAKDLIGDVKIPLSHAIRKLYRGIIRLTNEQSGGIGFVNFDSDIAYYIANETEAEITEELWQLYNDLNVYVRKGCEKAYITFNFGLDTTKIGRMACRSILNAYENGDDCGRPFIFPNLVFKLKKGININNDDINFDIFNKACRVTAKCMIPTYLNCDSTPNKEVEAYKLGVLGCRTRVVDNIFGEKTTINRGNIACVTINLVQLAIESNNDIDIFKDKIDTVMDSAKDLLIHRFNYLCNNANLNYINGKNLFLDSDKNNKDMLKNGTLSIGFIGLWDAIGILLDKKITKKDILFKYKDLAYNLVLFMNNKIQKYRNDKNLNFSLLASSAEGVCGEFAKYDKIAYKNSKILLDKDYYTNSFHVPVDLNFSCFEKIISEAPFHSLCTGGSITYIELKEVPINNIEAVKEIIEFARNEGCNYFGLNFPLDYCCKCGYKGIIKDSCDLCKSEDIFRIRRVSGYLATIDKFTQGKYAELKNRIAHISK